MIDVTANRSTSIGGSDAVRIHKGDWLSLYNEKMGIAEPVDLSDVFPVQLGKLTERFHLEWLRDKQGFDLILPTDEQPLRFQDDFMSCHLDAIAPDPKRIFEVKHSNSFGSMDDLLDRYMPQLQHNMYVTRADECVFSAIMGNSEPVPVRVAAHPGYQQELFAMERAFWDCIESETPPVDANAVTVENGKFKFKFDDLIEYDFDRDANNQWLSLAIDYTENLAASKTFEAAKKGLKDLVPDDARLVKGGGVTVKRDKRGSLRFS